MTKLAESTDSLFNPAFLEALKAARTAARAIRSDNTHADVPMPTAEDAWFFWVNTPDGAAAVDDLRGWEDKKVRAHFLETWAALERTP